MKKRKTLDILERIKFIQKAEKELQKELKIMKGVLKISRTKDVSKLIVGRLLQKKGFVSAIDGKINSLGRAALRRL